MGQRVQAATVTQLSAVCKALGWELLRAGEYGGEVGYLCRDESGIIEPHSEREILQTAAAKRVLRTRSTSQVAFAVREREGQA